MLRNKAQVASNSISVRCSHSRGSARLSCALTALAQRACRASVKRCQCTVVAALLPQES